MQVKGLRSNGIDPRGFMRMIKALSTGRKKFALIVELENRT